MTDPARTIVVARARDGRELDRWPANDPLATARLKALMMQWDYVSLEGEEEAGRLVAGRGVEPRTRGL